MDTDSIDATDANPMNLPPILRIPSELRLQIYDLAISNHWDTYPRIYSGFTDGLPEPPLLRVCRTLRSEGLKPYINILKAKQAKHLSVTMQLSEMEQAAKDDQDLGEQAGWALMNRLWIERDLLPCVQKELKRLAHFGIGMERA